VSEPAAIVVWERTGVWAAAIRRELPRSIRPVLEARSWDECVAHCGEHQSAWLSLELRTDNAVVIGQTLLTLQRQFPNARPVVVADPTFATLEFALRDCGALAVLTSVRQIAELGLAKVP